MKLLLTFLTISLFSFGANGTNYSGFMNETKCRDIGLYSKEYYHAYYSNFVRKTKAETKEKKWNMIKEVEIF